MNDNIILLTNILKNKDYLDLHEAEQCTGLKYSTLYKFIVIDREINHYKFGRKIVISKPDIRTFMESHCVKARGY